MTPGGDNPVTWLSCHAYMLFACTSDTCNVVLGANSTDDSGAGNSLITIAIKQSGRVTSTTLHVSEVHANNMYA